MGVVLGALAIVFFAITIAKMSWSDGGDLSFQCAGQPQGRADRGASSDRDDRRRLCKRAAVPAVLPGDGLGRHHAARRRGSTAGSGQEHFGSVRLDRKIVASGKSVTYV